jgi:thiosulfate dehydrogenase [quinone] large subunit
VRETTEATELPGVERARLVAIRVIPPLVRILAGLLWLANTDWKLPPDFGEATGRGLFGFVADGIEHPVLPPYAFLLETFVLPNIALFGWVTLLVETSLAALLITGTLTRLAALGGAAQALAITLTVSRVPGEWAFAYYLMVGLHLSVLAMDAGRTWGVDALVAKRHAAREDPSEFPAAERSLRIGKRAVVTVLGLLGVFLLITQPFVTSDFPFSRFHGVRGSGLLGLGYLALATLVWFLAGRAAQARTIATFALMLAVWALFSYPSTVNVLSAAPSSAAILAGTAAFLLGSAVRSEPR